MLAKKEHFIARQIGNAYRVGRDAITITKSVQAERMKLDAVN